MILQRASRAAILGRGVRLTHTVPKRVEVPSAIDWLPLPRALAYRKALLLLSLPVPPANWPSHLELASPLLATASAHLKSKGIAVNAIYDGKGKRAGFEDGAEEYRARLFFPDGHRTEYTDFNMDTISSETLLADLAYESNGTELLVAGGGEGIKEILICTHGSRDCRCADRGGPLVDALREEVERRHLGEKVKISEIAHVGGHKYAANAILLPSLDMLSNLTAEHAPAILSHLLSLGEGAGGESAGGKMWAHWRGRYGLTEAQQEAVWARVDPTRAVTQTQAPQPSNSTAMMDEQSTGGDKVEEKRETVRLRFKTFEGEEKIVEAALGENLLEVGKKNDLPSLEGVCGGNLECATCHLYLSTTPPPPIDEASDEEWDMLGYALGYKEDESRLGCQVKVTKELGKWVEEGGVIGLPRF